MSNALNLKELCSLVKDGRANAIEMLRDKAKPGTIWGRPDMRFAALVVGEITPGTTRISRFDADGFTGHTDVEDCPGYLVDLFGYNVKRMPAPEWMS